MVPLKTTVLGTWKPHFNRKKQTCKQCPPDYSTAAGLLYLRQRYSSCLPLRSDAQDIATLTSLKVAALDRAPLITKIPKAMAESNDSYAAARERARVTHLDRLIDDALAGNTPSFFEYTLHVAAIVPSTLPLWSISMIEAIAHVRDEHRMKLWSPARYVVRVCMGPLIA